MSDYSDNDRAIAVAGVFQAAVLTHDLARAGNARFDAFEASVHSIFQLDPPDVPSVYGGLDGIVLGLRTMYEHIQRPQAQQREMTGYIVALLQLDNRLKRKHERLAQLGFDVEELAARASQHDVSDSARNAALADIYQRHISTLTPRIMVKGEPLHLQNPHTAAKIRTALLAGIRAALLWRQCGGSRWKLLLGRRRLLNSAKALLDHIA